MESALKQVLDPIYRGEDVDIVLTTTDDGTITGWTVSAIASVQHESGGAITKTTTASQVAIDNAARRITISLLNADTVSLPPGKLVWEVRRTDSGNNRMLAGAEQDLR